MTLAKAGDYDCIEQGDTLKITGIYESLDSGAFRLNNITKGKTFDLKGEFTERQKAILKAGGLLKYVASEE